MPFLALLAITHYELTTKTHKKHYIFVNFSGELRMSINMNALIKAYYEAHAHI